MIGEHEYVVKAGDTLGAIARRHNVTVEQLASWNHIADPSVIRVGQKLTLRPVGSGLDNPIFSELWLRITDSLGIPIPNLRTVVVKSEGRSEYVTDDLGILPAITTHKRDDSVHVYVAKLDGGEKKVAQLTPPPGVHQVTLCSPKQKARLPLRTHDGGADHHESAPLVLPAGAVQHNRDSAGNPVANIGVECPNSDNLRLGANTKYRAYILTAAKRSGILSQGIAALISAEAGLMPAKIEIIPLLSKEGKPLVDKHGKPRTRKRVVRSLEWNPDVVNPIGAVGLTQFLKPAWLEVASTQGTLLHERIEELTKKTGVKALPEGDILALRTDPELSVVSAADYAVGNLKKLSKRGFKVDSLTDVNKVKLSYFLHHEGVGGAASILNGTLSDAKADSTLAQQFKTRQSDGTDEADAYRAKIGLTGAKAYRKFIYDYVDKKIVPRNFACDPSKVDDALSMEDIEKKLI